MPSRILFTTLLGAFVGGVRGWLWHREKLARRRRGAAPTAQAVLPPAVLGAFVGPEWGWVWFHSLATGSRGLGYYYRDSTLGPSLRTFADLRQNPDEATIRSEVAMKLPAGGSAIRLGPHRIVTTEGANQHEADLARTMFTSGRDPGGTADTFLLRVSPTEQALFELPTRPAFVDTII